MVDAKNEKKVFISQPNYIPWKGFFDAINMADQHIVYDDVQYTKKDWRNRNYIKSANGLLLLTLPVKVKGKFEQKINETKVDGHKWIKKHVKSILLNYKQAKHFDKYKDFIEDIYLNINTEYLCEINCLFLKKLCEALNIKTDFQFASDFNLVKGRTERVLDLCQQLQATHIINGPKAKDHMNEQMFLDAGIKVEYMDYSGYPEYNQLHPPFEHAVSVIDLLFNEGENSAKFMKSFV